jgi:repressor LexA
MKEKTNLYLDKELKNKLTLLAQKSRRSLSQYVEDLIDECPEPLPPALIPLLGTIPGGVPVEALEDKEPKLLEVKRSLLNGKDADLFFALKVRGNSMKDARIYDGSVILLEKRPAQSGDIIAALIDGECTLKRYLKEGHRHILKAENADFPDRFPLYELKELGVFRTVLID